MVFAARSFKRNAKLHKSRCKSSETGVSVSLNNVFMKQKIQSKNEVINDFEEEHLDFEPEFEDEYHNPYQNQSDLEHSQAYIYDSQSTTNVHNYDLDVSIAHRRDMLPIPESDAKDGRQNEYLPVYYPSSLSARTIDSSSEDGSIDSEFEKNYSDIPNSFVTDQYSCQSGGTENEDDSSIFSMTQEEEDRLLDSGEESQERPIVIQTGVVETCQIGNARITLPKFITSSSTSVIENQSNDLKRTKSTAKLRTLEGMVKKRKWDLTFKPEQPVTRVFLNDIGYISDQQSDMSGEHSSKPEPAFGSLIVICNQDKIVCEKPRANSQREIISKNVMDNFKLPLPPPKRPPTRPKRTVCNGENSAKNLQIKLSNKEGESIARTSTSAVCKDENLEVDDNLSIADKDDSLSLIASTFGGDIIDEVADSKELDDMSAYNEDQTEGNYIESKCIVERVNNWIQNVTNTELSGTNPNQLIIPPASTNISQSPKENVTTNSPSGFVKGCNRLNFKEIPNIFSGLCYYYFFFENCKKPRCTLSHVINKDKLIHKLLRCDPSDLYKAYQFSIPFEKIFKECYQSFISAFGKLKMQNELITCIKHFLQTNNPDTTEVVECAVKALEESGLLFQEAIEMISFNIGFLEHPILADILLELVIRKYEISENWEVIKRIAKARGKINPRIVTTMLERATSVYPLNKELCLEIYNLIIKDNMTDLSQIREEILVPYRTLVGFHDAIAPLKPPTCKIQPPRIVPLTRPNQNELLAAHIDHSLIKERKRFEQEIQGTGMQKILDKNNMGTVPNYSIGNSNFSTQKSFSDSHSSGSDERYFMPAPRSSPSSFNSMQGSPYIKNNLFSATSNIEAGVNGVNPDAALNFEPPTEISEYVPQQVNRLRDPVPEDEVSLTPSRPIFGRPCYRNSFSFERSLHNLLPDSFEHVNINEKDVAKLNSVIKSKNGTEFYKLLQYYKDPLTVENFITMTIANLKSCGIDICNTLISLKGSMESVIPDCTKDKEIKAIFEVIVMNLLFELEKKGLWKDGRNLLQLFCDWDSLVSSKIFSMRRISHMGRYIFIAKIFAKSKNFQFTYEILQSPNLNLLGPTDTWPYFYNSVVDLECRNTVLTEFFRYAHHYYIIGVADMFKRIYKYSNIYEFDAQSHFNPMLITLINEQQTSLLKYFFPDIDVYYQVMEKNVLRAFTVMLAPQLSESNLFRLYEFCCERQIYSKRFMGGEPFIIIKNNMFDVEIRLILSYYFYKLLETRHLPHANVSIHIKIGDNKPVYPKILQKCVRSIRELNVTIRSILKEQFSINTMETCTDQPPATIEILHGEVVKWLQNKQRWFPIYN